MEHLSKKIWRKYLRGNIERNQKKLLGVSESSSVIVGGILEIIISLVLKKGRNRMNFIKNFKQSEVLEFKEQVIYQEGQVVSKTLAQNSNVSITLFAFDKDEEISTHTSKGDALIYVMEGKVQVIIGDNKYELLAGQSILMPATIPHSVYALEKMKFMLTVVF